MLTYVIAICRQYNPYRLTCSMILTLLRHSLFVPAITVMYMWYTSTAEMVCYTLRARIPTNPILGSLRIQWPGQWQLLDRLRNLLPEQLQLADSSVWALVYCDVYCPRHKQQRRDTVHQCWECTICMMTFWYRLAHIGLVWNNTNYVTCFVPNSAYYYCFIVHLRIGLLCVHVRIRIHIAYTMYMV